MSRFTYAVIAMGVLFLSAYLFRKAAGTLSIKKLNIINFIFYDLLIFTFIGAFLILMGFRDHYLVMKIKRDVTIIKTCLIIGYIMIALPLAILIYNRLFVGRSIGLKLNAFIDDDVAYARGEFTILQITALLVLLGTLGTIYVFSVIGTIPLFNMLTGSGNMGIIRQQATRSFAGSQYIRNLLVLTITPLLSYLSYIYMRVSTKYRKVWRYLFIYTFILSILIKTYNLEKAPVIYYLFYFFIIEIVLGSKKVMKLFWRIFLVGTVVIVGLYYLFLGYTGSLFTVSSGPLGRIFMTQVATLFLHVQTFPDHIDYLRGASFPTALATLIGSPRSWVRSGGLVMGLYNSAGVRAGTAGVMNALFVGEAYANWGMTGVFVSPFVVALPFSLAFALLLRNRKTPASITFYLAMFISFTNSLQGGFIDYIYNASIIVVGILFLGLDLIGNGGKLVFRKKRRRVVRQKR